MGDYESKGPVAASAEEILKMMSSPEYLEKESLIDGAVKATARVAKNDGKNISIVVDREDPTREPGAKKGATEKVKVMIEWDVAARRNRWKTVVKGREKLVDIHGTTWIEPAGENRCNICEKGTVNINVPLIGKLVASGLTNDLRKSFPKKAALVDKLIKEKK
jgi:hypothetical protein